MRKNNKKMVSLNPEYGIEVTTLSQLADKIKDDNPELCSILTILTACIIANDEKSLAKYCNKYLTDKLYSDELKTEIQKMIDDNNNLDLL